jgi:hypothetical protein
MKRGSDDDSDDEQKNFSERQSTTGPSIVIDRQRRYFIGKDYSNCYEKDFQTLDKYSEGI